MVRDDDADGGRLDALFERLHGDVGEQVPTSVFEVPGKLLFRYRIRFGLYAVLSRLGAIAEWREIESRLSDETLSVAP